MKHTFSLLALALCVTAFSGKSSAAYDGSYPYKATATVGMVTDIVREVAGDKADVEAIIGSGVDPHLYSPTRNDVRSMMQADIVFYSGLLLEGRMTDVLVKVGRRKPVYAVTEMIDKHYLLTDPKTGHPDPHVWMDASGWMRATEAVIQSLSEFDPKHAELYQQKGEEYMKRLEELDAYAKTCIGSIPEKQRVMITAHDAFQYMGRAYNLEVHGIQGISTESEAGVQDVNRLVDMIVKRQIPAIFIETSVADKNVKALIEGAASRGHKVEIGGALFSDAMGRPGTYEGTYIGMIDHNVTTIARALGGEAPPKGMQGKLSSDSHE